jgi:phage gpG-like protein
LGARRLKIEMKFPDLAAKLEAKRHEVNLVLAANMQTNRGLLFDANGTRNGGAPWPDPLLRVGQPLGARGTLRKSMAPGDGSIGPDGVVRIDDKIVSIGTALPYAAMMNWGTSGLPGGVLRPVNAKVLAIPLPAGKRATEVAKEHRSKNRESGAPVNVMFRKSVRIPARRFDVLTPADVAELAAARGEKIAQVLA